MCSRSIKLRLLATAYRHLVNALCIGWFASRLKAMAVPPTVRIGVNEPVMARVPEGWFWMGCELGRDDEKPEHRVWVDAFDLAVHQVTNEEYAGFLSAMCPPVPPCWNDSRFNDPRMPVVAISWHEAMTYCEWLSCATGKPYRLPSEAEWERAARGGAEHSMYSWGDAPPRVDSGLRRALEERARAGGAVSVKRLRPF